jgi:DNA-binding transcriptional MerR regulator
MKIGELAAATGLTVDTLRYYEKRLVLDPPQRQANGYRRYGAQHVERLRFVHSARTMGFSLDEIAAILVRLGTGSVGRAELEHALLGKLDEVAAEIARLGVLEAKLRATLSSLSCAYQQPLSASGATLREAGQAVRIRSLKKGDAA